MSTKSKFEANQLRSAIALIGVFILAPCVAAQQADNSIHETINRSIPFIETKGADWIADKKCLSCHQIPFMYWSLNAADRHGLKVDQKKLAETNRWSTEWINLTNPKNRDGAEESPTLIQEHDAVAGLILGRPKNLADKDWLSNYRKHLVEAQDENGAWEPQGQLPLQKRTLRETKEVATMWALLALHDYGDLDKDAEYISEPLKWLAENAKHATANVSTEWWAARLLLASSIGDEEKADSLQKHLLSLQHDDGGWGWLSKDPSDAFGTGVALYALAHGRKNRDRKTDGGKSTETNSDVADNALPTNASIEKAISFLKRTQRKNGSWAVNGTKKNGRNRNTATAVYWGTCWAVIGMLETLEAPVD